MAEQRRQHHEFDHEPPAPVAPGGPLPGDEGFTLLELMIAVAILALLLAIAIPTFLGARTRAQDSQALSTVRATFDTAAAILSQPDVEGQPLDLLKTMEPQYNYTFAASTDPDTVSFALSAAPIDMPVAFPITDGVRAQEVNYAWAALIAARSRSGACVLGIWHMNAGTGITKVTEAEMPSCRAGDIDTTVFDDVYVKGGSSTGGSEVFVCADPSCFGEDEGGGG